MIPKTPRAADCASLLLGAALVATLAGCVAAPQTAAVRRPPQIQVQASFGIVDDYDYYPGYETYYSRTRHEYVYVENNVWVRRPAPSGVSVELLFASPSVRMDFRDAPEQHHRTIVRSYPRNWRPPGEVAVVTMNVVRQAPPPPAPVIVLDDYDYYPGYETYYSRAGHEYVYIENNAWVRRPAPRGVTVAVLFASPSVRMDFRDGPEQHHRSIIQDYPRNWRPPGDRRNDRTPIAVVNGNAGRQPLVVVLDDYDYYPGYETYYSRARHEYIYVENNAWVRRPAPRGVSVAVLQASPAARMDFHDAPENHHDVTAKTYPRNWAPRGKGRDDKDDDKNDRDDRNNQGKGRGNGRNN